jgi:hypothetical protein
MPPATSTRIKKDLIGGPVFWGALVSTLAALLVCLFMRNGRAWVGLGVLVTWTGFSAVNAIRSRRVHSIVSAPVYLAAAATLAGSATGHIDVQTWMIWVLGAGMIAANLSERVVGRYL